MFSFRHFYLFIPTLIKIKYGFEKVKNGIAVIISIFLFSLFTPVPSETSKKSSFAVMPL
jgi:hypothetical protein